MWHGVIFKTSQVTSTQRKTGEHIKYHGLYLIRKRIKLLLVVRLSDCRTAADHTPGVSQPLADRWSWISITHTERTSGQNPIKAMQF